jgi:osmotically-inducible protein OsmY
MKTDAQLKRDVLDELKWESAVNAAQIGVEVIDGVVTLTGQVSSFAHKCDAERAVLRIVGVAALAVEIEVKLQRPNERNDTDIARAANHVLAWTTVLPKDVVKIMVEEGWITLAGEVTWEYQREAASAGVRYLMGVKGVTNNITLNPEVSLSAVKSDIETALKRRAVDGSQDIEVGVRGADVTLTGKVHSWSERELATHAAWSTPGVKNVVDNLTLTP